MAWLFSEALDFALKKAGKDSNFKLKTEQKSIIGAVVDFFTQFSRPVTFLKNFLQLFIRRTSSQSGVTSIRPICFSFSARFSFIPNFPKLSVIARSVEGLEERGAATANYFINLRYTISSVFGDLLIPFKLITKISKSKKLFLPRIFASGGARKEER